VRLGFASLEPGAAYELVVGDTAPTSVLAGPDGAATAEVVPAVDGATQLRLRPGVTA
jgi:hypothetical protein